MLGKSCCIKHFDKCQRVNADLFGNVLNKPDRQAQTVASVLADSGWLYLPALR